MEVHKFEIRACIAFDERTRNFVISAPNIKGGPVIISPTENEGKTMFERAIKISFAVRNLLIFNQAIKAADERKSEITKIMKNRPEVSYSNSIC